MADNALYRKKAGGPIGEVEQINITVDPVTGDMTTGGNINDRDISADGTNLDNIRTTQGTSSGDTNLGAFTGSTISDNNSVKGSLQELETAVENVSGGGETAKVSANDTTTGYLEDKVVKGAGVIRTVINEGANEQLQFKLGPHYLSLASSGLYTGAVLSVGATQGTFNLTSGEGLFIDSTTDFSNIDVGPVLISARTNEPVTNIGTQPVTYILVDKNDNIVQIANFPTPEERRNNIFIGVVVHSDNVNVLVVNNIPSVALDISAQIQDLFNSLGFFNQDGNIISSNGANMSFNKSAGRAFKAGANFENNPKDPHTLTLPAQVAATFRYRNQDSSEGSDITVIDPTTYDVGGVTTVVAGSNNVATLQRIYIFPSGLIRVQRGQQIYAKLSDAIDAVGKEAFVTEPNIAENGLLLGTLAVIKGAVDLTNAGQGQFFVASRFGELGSVGSAGVGTLQDAYNNSIEPEIFTTGVNGALSIRRGGQDGINDDTDKIIEGFTKVGVASTFNVDGFGTIECTERLREINTASPAAIQYIDGTLLFDTTSTGITIALPSASIGKVKIPFKDIGANAGTNNITINRDGTDTIVTSTLGNTSVIINVNGDSGYLLSNGVDTWYLIGGYQNLA